MSVDGLRSRKMGLIRASRGRRRLAGPAAKQLAGGTIEVIMLARSFGVALS